MINLEKYDFSSIKYLSASFLATYCSGLVHPLDVIKTRLQSISFLRKVMMEKVKPKILFLSMVISKMLSNTSIETKVYVDSTKDSMSPYYVKQVLWPYSFGCKY